MLKNMLIAISIVAFGADQIFFQQAPVLLAGNAEQKKKYIGRLIEEPLIAVSLDYH